MNQSISTSPSLIQRVQEREENAWDRFVQIYTPLIHHWILRSGASDADVGDILQDVFHAVATNVRRYESAKGSGFRGWLWGVTQNKIAMHFRNKARQPQGVGGVDASLRLAETAADLQQPPSDPQQDLVLLARRAADLIRVDFAAHTYQAFWLVAVEGRSPKDVAAELKMSVAAVYKAKSRVLAHLRRELEFPEDLTD